jgi:hypothetical protein
VRLNSKEEEEIREWRLEILHRARTPLCLEALVANLPSELGLRLFGFPIRLDSFVPYGEIRFHARSGERHRYRTFQVEDIDLRSDQVQQLLDNMVGELVSEQEAGLITSAMESRGRNWRIVVDQQMEELVRYGGYGTAPTPPAGLLSDGDGSDAGAPAPAPKEWEPEKGLKVMFHGAGRFTSPEGKRFDYVFPELIKHPDLPAHLLPPHKDLGTGCGFSGRIRSRHDDCLRLGEVVRIQGGIGVAMPGNQRAIESRMETRCAVRVTEVELTPFAIRIDASGFESAIRSAVDGFRNLASQIGEQFATTPPPRLDGTWRTALESRQVTQRNRQQFRDPNLGQEWRRREQRARRRAIDVCRGSR